MAPFSSGSESLRAATAAASRPALAAPAGFGTDGLFTATAVWPRKRGSAPCAVAALNAVSVTTPTVTAIGRIFMFSASPGTVLGRRCRRNVDGPDGGLSARVRGQLDLCLYHICGCIYAHQSSPFQRMRKAKDEQVLRAAAAEIKARRGRIEISQEELAHRADVHRSFIARVEVAQTQPSLAVLVRIADALEIDAAELVRAIVERCKHEA